MRTYKTENMERILLIEKVSKWLVGSHIDCLKYYITGWELRFVGEKHITNSIFFEIEVLDEKNWNALLDNAPLDIKNTSEPKDTISAIILFTAINRYAVSFIEIDNENNLTIIFENKSKIRIPAQDKLVFDTWILQNEYRSEIISCYCGELTLEVETSNPK